MTSQPPPDEPPATGPAPVPDTPGDPGLGVDPEAGKDPGVRDDPEAGKDPGAHDDPEAGAAGAQADPLPQAPLFALLRVVEQDIGVDRIDRLWIFPPRRMESGETALLVVAAFPEIDPGRRRVYAAHYTAPAEAAEPRLVLDEFGTAPVERVGRLVEDVAERLKDQPTAPPEAARIDRDPERWNLLLHSLAERHLEAAAGHRRLPRDPRTGVRAPG
jgi:hypothetical protein